MQCSELLRPPTGDPEAFCYGGLVARVGTQFTCAPQSKEHLSHARWREYSTHVCKHMTDGCDPAVQYNTDLLS